MTCVSCAYCKLHHHVFAVVYLILFHPLMFMMCWCYWKTIFTPVATTPKQVSHLQRALAYFNSSSSSITIIRFITRQVVDVVLDAVVFTDDYHTFHTVFDCEQPGKADMSQRTDFAADAILLRFVPVSLFLLLQDETA